MSELVVHRLPVEIHGLHFYNWCSLSPVLDKGKSVVNCAIAFSFAVAEKAGVLGERDGALERDTITRLQSMSEKSSF